MHVQVALHTEMKLLRRAGCDVVEEKAGWKLFLQNVRQRQGAGRCPVAFEWLPAARWFRCSSPHASRLCAAQQKAAALPLCSQRCDSPVAAGLQRRPRCAPGSAVGHGGGWSHRGGRRGSSRTGCRDTQTLWRQRLQ